MHEYYSHHSYIMQHEYHGNDPKDICITQHEHHSNNPNGICITQHEYHGNHPLDTYAVCYRYRLWLCDAAIFRIIAMILMLYGTGINWIKAMMLMHYDTDMDG